MTLKRSEGSAHDFIVKFSPSVCSVVASLTGEMAVPSFAYHAGGTNPAVIHGHDKTSAMHARSGSPPDDNHLTSISYLIGQ